MSPTSIREPCVARVTIADPNDLFSTFRRSFFFPMSYILRALPTPATSRPWNANSDNGTSSVSVYHWIKDAQLNCEALGRKLRALCMNSSPAPSSVKLYVQRKPLEHERGERKVSAAVPTTRCKSPPRAEKGTIAKEKAASFPSNGMSAGAFAYPKSDVKLLIVGREISQLLWDQ